MIKINNNRDIADVLGRLSQIYETRDDGYRARAYRNAALAIGKYPIEIKSGEMAKKNIKGVGKSIAEKIDEYLQTGTLKIFETLSKTDQELQSEKSQETLEQEKTLEIFKGIYGVGAVTAKKWYDLGYRTLEDLKNVKKTNAQQLGYIYYYHLKLSIPRHEMDILNQRIDKAFSKLENKPEYMICGSYRRGSKTSNDIDCLVKGGTDLTLNKIVNSLIADKLIVGHLALGDIKYLGLCRIDNQHNVRRIDIMIVKPESWAYATLYFTGSKELNILMRNKAIELGYTLNEYGLYDENGKLIPAKTEKDIFTSLNMKYLQPTERDIAKQI